MDSAYEAARSAMMAAGNGEASMVSAAGSGAGSVVGSGARSNVASIITRSSRKSSSELDMTKSRELAEERRDEYLLILHFYT